MFDHLQRLRALASVAINSLQPFYVASLNCKSLPEAWQAKLSEHFWLYSLTLYDINTSWFYFKIIIWDKTKKTPQLRTVQFDPSLSVLEGFHCIAVLSDIIVNVAVDDRQLCTGMVCIHSQCRWRIATEALGAWAPLPLLCSATFDIMLDLINNHDFPKKCEIVHLTLFSEPCSLYLDL